MTEIKKSIFDSIVIFAMLASLMTLILWADAKKERDFAEKQQQIQMQTEGIQQLSKK